jgi:hypothetical protein
VTGAQLRIPGHGSPGSYKRYVIRLNFIDLGVGTGSRTLSRSGQKWEVHP